MHRYLGRSHETTFGTGQLERRETILNSDTQQVRRHGVEIGSCKEGRGTRHSGQYLRDIVESIRVRHEGSPSDDEIRKKRQRDDESVDRFLDDLESLRRRSDPEESTKRRNFSIASKFIDGVKSDDFRTMLATYYTLSKDSAPTPEEMRQKSREYMLMKPKKYSFSDNRNMQGGSQPQRSSWYKPRDDMDKRKSCANCGSADHHVAECTTYKQGMKSLGYAPDEEDMSQIEEHEFYNGLIIKICARCFFCNQEGHFKMDCPLFWEAVKNQSHPKHMLELAAVQNQRNSQTEFETKNSEAPSAELPTKTVKAVTQVNSAIEATARNALEINYEKAAAEAINKVKQDLATKEIEQR